MKTKITALALAAATAFSLAPKSANAGDKEWAIVGGVVGGLIIASALADSHHDVCTTPATTLVVDRGCDRYVEPCETGYWRSVDVRVWVPGCWVVERRYGCRDARRYVEGHYDCRVDRVWVANDRYGRHERYDRPDRGEGRDRGERHNRTEVGSGYGRRR